MTMHTIDWLIVAALLAVIFAGALSTRRYTRSVSAFLAASRCGRRYLISMAFSIASVGVITLVWYFEQNYKVGFTPYWWGLMEGPAMIVMALSGWVLYRYRQTRAMTLAQFFEVRYSRRFRIFAGFVAFLAGLINFGIFPSIGARFFIALCGLPEHLPLLGLAIPMYPLLMVGLLAISLLFVFVGGQIAVMVTDFLQGVFCNIVFIVIVIALLSMFRWEQIGEVLLAAPAGESPVDPFDLGQESHFDVWYYVISVIIIFYGALAWQGAQGYNCAAVDAHEAKMAGILNGWRPRVLMLIVIVAPICIRTFLHHPDFAADAAPVHAALDAIETEPLQNQLRTPLALAALLPPGLLGLLCAAMLGAFISTHDTYLHSWGSILVQDVILPFRRKPFTPEQHLRVLRFAIVGVAIAIFLFSLLFEHTQYIAMFVALSGAVFVGGAGSVIIGGLYWKRGTTAAAWSAMLTGMLLSLTGIVMKQFDPDFFLTGQEMTFWAIAASIAMYVLVSLLGPRAEFNMDRMLHRGDYALPGETTTSWRDSRTWMERLGFSRDFTGWDRVVTLVTLSWPLFFTVLFVVGTVYCLLVDVPAKWWLGFWRIWTWFLLACAIGVTIWFSIGGFRDLRALFKLLREQPQNVVEDGRVEDHRNVGE
ncbi:MAG: sodium:solute symporter [Phycisphaerales bacterium]|nr:sodium:solute symporter [Phycisphaerae bacterium]NNF41810.1 sodium:solute symporter [Phycisphaerales bacterium]NNM25585.1 sodium:solute symporter [Phycisphaerales bacterium]